MIYILLTENLTEKIRPKNTAKTFQTKFLKILNSYDFLWTNVSVGGRDLVSLLVTFLNSGKRRILDIAMSGFQIKVSKWLCDWLLQCNQFENLTYEWRIDNYHIEVLASQFPK